MPDLLPPRAETDGQASGRRLPEIVSWREFPVHRARAKSRRRLRALLLSPPVYDAQYWARWSQPAGLLRIASYLKEMQFDVRLVDAMECDSRGFVPKHRKRDECGRIESIKRDDVEKAIWHFGRNWPEIESLLRAGPPPDEIWISSVMTYWWESTRDAVALARKVFPRAKIFVGGIYPTLATDHAQQNLVGADVVFKGELPDASDLPTDLTLYETPPSYAIITTSRGCPWDCNYCAARTLNGGSNKVRGREPDDVLAEIRHKKRSLGIRHFGFYEDNALILRGHLQEILERIVSERLSVTLYAPEGFETRLLTGELCGAMKKAGFKKIHLPFEALKWETTLGWNRRHASTASFEVALEAAIAGGFKPRTEQLNAFVLFGLPDEKIEDLLDSVAYVHHMVGSIIPMLFTPVPGTNVFREHETYLRDGMGWDLQHLNGKFLPFLEYNQRKHSGLRAGDYLQLENLMSVLNNGKFFSESVNICDSGPVSTAFREILLANKCGA